jgi:1-acyl-sn-glycerol-3-phosphate acyltransferase
MILDSKNLIYKAVYHGARSFIEVFATLEVEGWENVPDGACLFASNHQSMLDPPLLGSCLPREISFIARRTLFDNPVFGFVIRACHSIPVDRGEADIGAIRAALAALGAGEGLLIFPEGTRSHDGVIASPKDGAGLQVRRAGRPDPHPGRPRRAASWREFPDRFGPHPRAFRPGDAAGGIRSGRGASRPFDRGVAPHPGADQVAPGLRRARSLNPGLTRSAAASRRRGSRP